MIRGRGIDFAYGSSAVLKQVDVTAHPSQVLGLVGPNGSGKTTLLRTLYGSLTPAAGAILIGREELSSLSAKQIAQRLSVVVQEASGDLPVTVADMVLLGRTPHRTLFGRSGRADQALAAAALAQVGALHLAEKSFDDLSGGERQRVLIARALAQEAEYVLLDEPTNHLDVRFQHEVLQLVQKLAHQENHTIVVVLHDLNLAATYCDSIALLDRGHITAYGSPSEVLTAKNLEPVYEVNVERIAYDEGFQLVFRPYPTPDLATPTPTPLNGVTA